MSLRGGAVDRARSAEGRPSLPLLDVPAMDRQRVRHPREAVRWTCTPAAYRSSPIAVRTHYGRCGTPLSLAYDSRIDLAFAVGSFDAPEAVTPTHHYGVESRIRWADIGSDLPDKATRERW